MAVGKPFSTNTAAKIRQKRWGEAIVLEEGGKAMGSRHLISVAWREIECLWDGEKLKNTGANFFAPYVYHPSICVWVVLFMVPSCS